MRRQMKLIGMILAHVEKSRQASEICLPDFKDYRTCDVEYHVQLCEEAGYLHVSVNSGVGSRLIAQMTWQGHDVLDGLRASRSI